MLMADLPTTPNPEPRSPRIHGGYKGSVGAFCCVPGCSNARGRCNRKGMTISFHKFPADKRRSELWLNRIRCGVVRDGIIVPFVPKTHSTVCSEHFEGGQKIDNPESISYVPTLFPRNSVVKRSTLRSKQAGFATPLSSITKRKNAAEVCEAGRPKCTRKLDYAKGKNPKAVWETTDHDYIKTKCSSDDLDENLINMADLKSENEKLKSQRLRLENIKDDDDKFQFYTNLPNYQVFKAISDYLKTRTKPGGLVYWRGKDTSTNSEKMSKGPDRKFDFEEEFFITLIKLKTGNFNEDLAQTFDTSQATISRIFSTWINFLSTEFKILFEMQANDDEKAECYSSFNNLKIVIDCTELMVQRASNLEARKKTFSNYKHHDTVKFLVGLSPSLAVNYVSQAWGGRASDKHITVESKTFVDGLGNGEVVMADRGFNISSELKKKGVKLLIPEFKGRDRPQISSQEAQRSEYISKARIHVERIIQRIKTFYFLERVVRLNMMDIIEQIFIVCSYLTNFQLPIIRKTN